METITFGQLAGIALYFLAIAIGLALLFHGWPDFKRRK